MSRPNLNTLPHKKCRYRVKFLSAAGGRVLVPGGGGGDAGHSGALDSVVGDLCKNMIWSVYRSI